MDPKLQDFLDNLLPISTVLSIGKATVMGHTTDAALVRNNVYGQDIVWGVFNVDKGKYKGVRLTNNAATEDVIYEPSG